MNAPDSRYSWLRLAICTLFSTIGGAGMWSFVVMLPAIQADFGITRGEASLPYTVLMVGFAFGSIVTGRLADRFGIRLTLVFGALAVSLSYVLGGMVTAPWQLAVIYALLGLGTSAGFGPLIADVSHWFERWRGIAVGICSAGNYLSGALWPPVISHFITASGWRATHIGVGLFCLVTLVPLALLLGRRMALAHGTGGTLLHPGSLGLSPTALQVLLSVAGVACCVAMSMPQVHIVAYCSDLGYGPARGAEMLSVMLGCGIV
ncbi:MAG: MFS transporter, partial [Xanthobacteraceae bacterium]|nr:MFS transporter [Xanthobacteraceae bacterium]